MSPTKTVMQSAILLLLFPTLAQAKKNWTAEAILLDAELIPFIPYNVEGICDEVNITENCMKYMLAKLDYKLDKMAPKAGMVIDILNDVMKVPVLSNVPFCSKKFDLSPKGRWRVETIRYMYYFNVLISNLIEWGEWRRTFAIALEHAEDRMKLGKDFAILEADLPDNLNAILTPKQWDRSILTFSYNTTARFSQTAYRMRDLGLFLQGDLAWQLNMYIGGVVALSVLNLILLATFCGAFRRCNIPGISLGLNH